MIILFLRLLKNAPSVACVVYDSTLYPSTFIFLQTSSGHQVQTEVANASKKKKKNGCCSAIQIEYNPLGNQEVPLLSLFIILERKNIQILTSSLQPSFVQIICWLIKIIKAKY